MRLPPEPKLKAILEVLYSVLINGRYIAYEGHVAGLPASKADQLADLLDAVHALPRLLIDWPECNEELMRAMLRDYDRKWNSGLLDRYEQVLADHSSEQ